MQLLGLPPPTHARLAGVTENIYEGRKHGALGAWVKTGNFFLDRFRSRVANITSLGVAYNEETYNAVEWPVGDPGEQPLRYRRRPPFRRVQGAAMLAVLPEEEAGCDESMGVYGSCLIGTPTPSCPGRL